MVVYDLADLWNPYVWWRLFGVQDLINMKRGCYAWFS